MGLRNELSTSVATIEEHLRKFNKPFLPDLITPKNTDQKNMPTLDKMVAIHHALNRGTLPTEVRALSSDEISTQLKTKKLPAESIHSATMACLNEAVSEAKPLINTLSAIATANEYRKADSLKIKRAMQLFGSSTLHRHATSAHKPDNATDNTKSKQSRK